MGSSVAEVSFGVPGPTEGEGSWAADAEAEVLELLVALKATNTRITSAGEERLCRARDSKHTTGCIATDADIPVLQTAESI
jgi:hypothetical protein